MLAYYVHCNLHFNSLVIYFSDNFKYEIKPLLKANHILKFAQHMTLNNVIKKRKPLLKLSYNVLKEEDGYDPLLEISPYPTLIHVKDYLDSW